MLKMKKISELYSMRVYTDHGEYVGDIEEAVLTKTKISSWRVKATKTSSLSRIIGQAKGVIVSHQFVKSIGDVMIISNSALPTHMEPPSEEEA